jgi:hypothetical protein
MARFDVRRLRSKARVRLVVEIQSDYMRDIPTVLIAPVIAVKDLEPYQLINPIVEVAGEKMALRLEQMAGVPAAALGAVVGSVGESEDKIAVALHKLLFYV